MKGHLRSVTRLWGLALLLVGAGLVIGGPGATAEAATLHVRNNGQDSGTCGAAASPCRSISQAIANAVAGDTLMVGPGRYGDLDGSGTFTPATGEEAAEVNTGCDCMFRVNKTLTILSSAGAGATVLDAGGAPINVVRTQISGVVFGKARRGFTLTNGGAEGVLVHGSTSAVTVAGNLARGVLDGFVGFGSGHRFIGNVASGNGGTGFVVDGSGHLASGNLATSNSVDGFFVDSPAGNVITGNMTSANGRNGFSLVGDGNQLTGNIASANGSFGLEVLWGQHVLSGNAIHGNQSVGILLGDGTSRISAISQNNIFGNDPVSNCGLWNLSWPSTISATKNFWGAASGPGAAPADNVCNGAGSSTMTAPPATKEFKGKAKPLF